MEEEYKFIQNKKCEYFPCHKLKEEIFNCLFCYCPLYMLGSECGGNFTYTKTGIKSCMDCSLPHVKGIGYDFVMDKMGTVIDKTKKQEE